jgi:uncharacterized protein YukE
MKKPISKTSKSSGSLKKLSPEVREALDAYHAETQAHIDALNKKSDEDIKRYIGSLTEEYQGRTSAIAEQFSGLNEKVDTINQKLDMHTEIIGIIAEDVAVLKEDVAEIKDELKNKADKTEVIHLSRRVSVLEHRV